MKALLSVLIIVAASFVFSAQMQWAAYGISTKFETNATAYLVQSSVAVTQSYIATELAKGIPSSVPSTYTSYTPASVTSTSGYQYVAPTSITSDSNFTLNNWFIVILSEDQTLFAISAIETASSGDGGASATLNANVSSLEGYWTEGSIGTGGDTPGVPEPTAFALLALGVAGMALRRKVK